MSSSEQSASRELWRLIGGSAFIFACRVTGAVLTFASQVLLARWMGAAELGAYVIAFSWCILLSTVATAGLPSAAIRFIGVALASGDYATVIGFHRRSRLLVLGLGLGIAIVGTVTMILAGTAVPPGYREPVLLGLATVPLFALLVLCGGVANSFSWLGQSFLPGNVFRPLFFLGAVAFVGSQQPRLDATTAMQVQWAVLLVISAAAALRLEQRIHRAFAPVAPRYETRLWMRTALPLLGVTVFTGYLAEITVVLVGMQLPSHEVAIFQVSYRVALLIAFGLNAVDAFTAPEAARFIATTDRDSMQRMVNRATRLRFWPALAAVGLLAAVGRPVLGLFGQEFHSGYLVLVILAAAQLPLAAVGPVMRLLSVSGHEDHCLRASLGSLAILVPLVGVLVSAFGTTGAALAALLDMAIWSLWMRWLVVRFLDIRPTFL